MQWVAELEIFLKKKHFILNSKGMINGARISRRPAGPNAGLDISLFALCSARQGGPGNEGGREGSSTCLWPQQRLDCRCWEVVDIIDMSGKLDQWEGSWVT